MVTNYTGLAQWLESFAETDARELIGFDVAMVVCGCYNVAIRGVSRSIEMMLSQCKMMETLQDISQADYIAQRCAAVCGDKTAGEVLNKLVADHTARCGNMQDIADRLSGEDIVHIGGLRDGVSGRFEALKDAVIQLALTVGAITADLEAEQARCRRLEAEKSSMTAVLTATEEEHEAATERVTGDLTSRIKDLSKLVDQQDVEINKLKLCHNQQKGEWDTIKTELVGELDKLQALRLKDKNHFDTVYLETEEARAIDKNDIDTLSHTVARLEQEKKALLREHAIELDNLRAEREMAQGAISTLEQTVIHVTAEMEKQLKGLDALRLELNVTKDDLAYNMELASVVSRYEATLISLSLTLGLDLKTIQPSNVPAAINKKVVDSASWLEGVLRESCVTRGDAVLDIDSHSEDAAFHTYESVIIAALRRLGDEQSPMDVNSPADKKAPKRRKVAVAVYQSKKKCDGDKDESSHAVVTTPSVDEKLVDTVTSHALKKEISQRGERFTIPVNERVSVFSVAVCDRVAGVVADASGGRNDHVVLVDLGADSPLSLLQQLLQVDSATDTASHLRAACHCSDLDSMATMCECTLVTCWSRLGLYELYGMQHHNNALYVVIILDTGLGLSSRYYVLAIKADKNEYVYNLVDKQTILTHNLSQLTLFAHSVSDCKGPPGNVTDNCTRFPSIRAEAVTLGVRE